MKKTFVIFVTTLAIIFTSCNSKNNAENLDGVHKVIVKEILQANAYTYLNVTENETDQWIAVSKMDAKLGETYYFKDFMEMKYFESKDLGRAFESIYFIEDLKTSPEAFKAPTQAQMPEGHPSMESLHEGKPAIAKDDVKVDAVEGGITIAELYSNKDKYNGKKVLVRGKVVKVNFGIMDKNWFHIQDGTSADGKFDLTITSMEENVKLNDVLTFEGTVVLNKDFGYGYSYELLLEEGIKK